jgi:hypothetical protein
MTLINVYCSKIPMQWVTAKDGSKIKFLEFKNAKDPKGTILYGLKQGRPEEYELSNNFDSAMIKAIKAVGGIKTNVIVVKGISTKYNGKLWMKVQPNCEIIVIDGLTKRPKFREVISGTDKAKSVEVDESFKEVIQTEIRKALKEYGAETMYFGAPGGVEQIGIGKTAPAPHRFYDLDKWKTTAMQMGCTLRDRGDDWIAILPDTTTLGTYDKMSNIGTLTM